MFETAKHGKAHTVKDGMVHDEGHVIHDVKEAARHFKGDAKDAAAAVRDDLEDVARRTGHHARELADSAGHSLADVGAAMKVKIRDNPVQSSLIALGIGLMVGALYRR